MPLPWKKAKGNRISRIVADLQSPKRGGSLVVETGFPTSLIDLFVKNRDRLKKPSMKMRKKKKKTINDPNPVDTHVDTRVPDPVITANSESGSENWSVRVGPICEEVKNSTEPEPEPVAVVVEEEEEEEENVEPIGSSPSDPITTMTTTRDEIRVEEFVGGGCSGGSVLMAVLKVFLVVVLALSTKKLAVGITLSAFLLFFLEYVAKRWVRFLRPCSEMEVRLRSLVNWVSTLFWFKKDILVEEANHVVEAELVDETDSKSSYEEIEILELNNDDDKNGEEFLSTGPELEFLSRDKKWGFLSISENKETEAMEDDGEVVVLEKIKSSKRAKIKAKIIKNFVPKRLRSSKKGKKNCKENNNEVEPSSDVSSFFELEEQEDQRSETIKESVNGEIPSFDEGLQSGMELSMVSEEEEEEVKGREERKGNWVYLTLVLIALAGLFGGRIVALLLTISWCFLLKLIGKTQGRLINMTITRSSFAISS